MGLSAKMVAVACRSAPVQKMPVSGTDLRRATQMTEIRQFSRPKIPAVDDKITTVQSWYIKLTMTIIGAK